MPSGDVYRAQIQMPYVGVFDGSDLAENDLHFIWQGAGDAPDASDFEDVADRITAFYGTVVTETGLRVATFISERINRDANGCFINFYKVPDTPGDAGPPVYETVWTFPSYGIGGTPLPEQLAIACTIHATLTGIPEHSGGTRPKARRRGRFYVGPFNTTALGPVTAEKHIEVNTSLVITLAHACDRLTGDPITQPMALAVFSRTDWVGRAVTGGWVDDHFDVQRRRADPTRNKTLWGTAP